MRHNERIHLNQCLTFANSDKCVIVSNYNGLTFKKKRREAMHLLLASQC